MAPIFYTVYCNGNVWTPIAMACLTLNCVALVGNILAEKYVIDDLMNSSWRWLETHHCFSKVATYTIYVCCYVTFGYTFYVLWIL